MTAACPKDNLGGIQEFSSPENTTELIERQVNVSMRSVVLLNYEIVWMSQRIVNRKTQQGGGGRERGQKNGSLHFPPPLFSLHS